MKAAARDTSTVDISTRLGTLRVRTIGTGPPAVLWHSLFVDSTSWDAVLDTLASQRRLILIDGPSHGASAPVRRRFTLSDCADAAVEVLDQLGVRAPVDWVGNAWGGHIGIVFASSHPARVRSLVTIGTPVRALTSGERRRIRPLVGAYRLVGPIKPLMAGVQDALLGPGATDTHMISGPLRAANRRGMYTAMRSVMLARPSLLGLLPTIRTPTLFLAVNEDPYGSPSETRAAAELLPDGRFGTLAGAGHVAPLLQSAPDVARIVADFWREVRVTDRPGGAEAVQPMDT
jgi:pimeloyl-ACP methyl ester carboxylesterase